MTFTEAVCRVVFRIPPGRVATYGEVAAAAGYPRSARAVASALRAGPRTLPWHRVLGAGGLVRLAGEAGLEQRFRLAAEGIHLRGKRVPLGQYGWRIHWKR